MRFFKPAKPAPPVAPQVTRPAPSAALNGLLDPLPQPDVVESDSDTSWALWEDSVQSQNPELDALGDQETVPMPLMDESPVKKSPR